MRESRPTLQPLPSENGWYVLATWPTGETEKLNGFASQADAADWIEKRSKKWMRKRA